MIHRHLERLGIPHRYVDLEHDPVAGAELRWWSGGRMSHPTVSIGGALLVEPTLDELDGALAEAGGADLVVVISFPGRWPRAYWDLTPLDRQCPRPAQA